MKSGFVSIIGRPNVGKSSLLNKILKYKLSIISSKPQTTRDQIKGIYNDNNSQIVFIDTPGIHKPKQMLGESLNEKSYKSLKDADLILFLQPINEKIGPGDKRIIELINMNKNFIAVITKLDLSDPQAAKTRAQELKTFGFKDVIGVSINIDKSIDDFIEFIKNNLKEGPSYYDREDITDVSLRFIAKEIIRECAIENTHEELPHSLAVFIEDFDDSQTNISKIKATIFVERESQKGILIGKQGQMIKKIGTEAREKLEISTNKRYHLDLKIKVNKKWTNDKIKIKKMGY